MVTIRETSLGRAPAARAGCSSCSASRAPRRTPRYPTAGLGAVAVPPTLSVDALVQGFVPLEAVEAVVAQIVATEQSLYAAFQLIDKNKTRTDDAFMALRKQYQQAFAQHNTFKFWAMLIPAFRNKLSIRKAGQAPTGNAVAAPSIGVLRAASSNGWVPNEADAAKWIADNAAKDTVADLQSKGELLAGFTTTAVRRGPRGLQGLGLALPAVLAVAAAAIVALIVIYYGVREAAETIRATLDAGTTRDLAAKEAAGAVAKGTTASFIKESQKTAQERAKSGNLLGGAASIVKWLAIGAGVIFLAPPVIRMVTTKRGPIDVKARPYTEPQQLPSPQRMLPGSPTAGLGGVTRKRRKSKKPRIQA